MIEKELGVKPELVPGGIGQFEVFVDDEKVVGKDEVSFFSKLLGNKGIPDHDRVIEALRATLPGQEAPA